MSSSLFNKSSRYVHGGNTEKGELGVEWWERFNFGSDESDDKVIIDAFHKGRLDLIANAFYGEPRYWWILAQINNILDPHTEVSEGRIIFVPKKERLLLLLNGRVGGSNSTREKNSNVISPIVI